VPKRTQFGSSLRKFTQTKVGLLKGKLKEGKLKTLQSDLQHPQNKCSVDTKSSEAASHAGFAISKLLQIHQNYLGWYV
jgi:hypothetical protein